MSFSNLKAPLRAVKRDGMDIARLWWVYFKTIISYRHLDLGWVSFLPFFLSSVLCVNRDRILNDAEVTKNCGASCSLRKLTCLHLRALP